MRTPVTTQAVGNFAPALRERGKGRRLNEYRRSEGASGVPQCVYPFNYAHVGGNPGVDFRGVVVSPLLPGLGHSVILQTQTISVQPIEDGLGRRAPGLQRTHSGDALQDRTQLLVGLPIQLLFVGDLGGTGDGHRFGVVIMVVQVHLHHRIRSRQIKSQFFGVAPDVTEPYRGTPRTQIFDYKTTFFIRLYAALGLYQVNGSKGKSFLTVLVRNGPPETARAILTGERNRAYEQNAQDQEE